MKNQIENYFRVEQFCGNGAQRYRAWCRHDKPHREDGPAREWFASEGQHRTAEYFLGGEYLPKKEHRRQVALRKLTASVADRLEVSL